MKAKYICYVTIILLHYILNNSDQEVADFSDFHVPRLSGASVTPTSEIRANIIVYQ
jgi:hypothetical protein